MYKLQHYNNTHDIRHHVVKYIIIILLRGMVHLRAVILTVEEKRYKYVINQSTV